MAIDINSGKSTKASDIEATALQTNIEAAEEIARQCRLRDLGGLIVIDFIDMRQYKNQRAVENTLKAAVRIDRARVSIGGISKFGLLEMSRQRLRPSLDDSAYGICRNCSGIGKVRSTESLALSVLRLVGEEARKEKTKSVIADIPSDTANYLLKEKSDWINDIEEREKIDVVLKANPNLSSVNFSIKRVREDDSTTTTYGKPSFGVSEKDLRPNANKNKSAVVKTEQTNEQEPITAWNVDDMKGPTLIDRLKFWILSAKKPKVKKKQTKAPGKNRNNQRRVRKPHSKNTRKKQSSHSKSKKPNASKHTANKKKPVSKKRPTSKTKKATTPVKGVKAAKAVKATKKTANPKNKETKANQKKLPAKKTTKQPKKIVKNSKKEPVKKVSEKITTSEKVLPWEDIVPPK